MTKLRLQNLARKDGLFISFSGKNKIAWCKFKGAIIDGLINKYKNLFDAIGYKSRLSI